MPDAARKWLERHAAYDTELALPESANDLRVSFRHLCRLLEQNERLEAERDEWQAHAELDVEVGAEWQRKCVVLEADRRALVAYVRSSWEDSLSKETQEAWQALSEELRREVDDA